MKKTILLLLLGLTVAGCSKKNQTANNQPGSMNWVCYKSICYKVEIADDDQERFLGLMNREKLDQDKGMLFLFPQSDFYGFWMKKTKMPLDFIWLDEERRVVFIKEDNQPCQTNCPVVAPDKKAKFVLEINSGGVKKMDLQLGAVMVFDKDLDDYAKSFKE
ncbi:DUF192 domain-containing protein [Candidatus Parcubacteria bacterium]|nr:MAG: DUF192 domain-containing protein [Candidatus Parcubacteria bacterium]